MKVYKILGKQQNNSATGYFLAVVLGLEFFFFKFWGTGITKAGKVLILFISGVIAFAAVSAIKKLFGGRDDWLSIAFRAMFHRNGTYSNHISASRERKKRKKENEIYL